MFKVEDSVKMIPATINSSFLNRWTWIFGIFLALTLILPVSVRFPVNTVLLTVAALILVFRGFWEWRARGNTFAEKIGFAVSALIVSWVILNLALHRFHSNRPLEWLAIVAGLILFWLGRLASGEESSRWPIWYLRLLVLLAVAEGSLGIIQISWPEILTPGLRSDSFPRACGTFTNPNQYAGWMAATLPALILLTMASGKKRFPRIRLYSLSILGAVTIIAGLIASQSRGALSALLFALLNMGVVFGCTRRRMFLYIPLTLILVALFAGVATTVWSYRNMYKSIRADGGSAARPLDPNARRSFFPALLSLGIEGRALADPTVHDRLAAASACLQMWKDHPWLGVGPGNYTRFAPKYLHETRDPVFFNTGAHSLPFQWLAELGVIGGLIWPTTFGLMLVTLYQRLRRAPPGSQAARAAFCLGWSFFAVWIHNLVDVTVVYHPLKYVFPFLTALAVAWPPDGVESTVIHPSTNVVND